jgi:hypothetical protein
MADKFSIARIAPLPAGVLLADGTRTNTPHVAVWVSYEGSMSVFQFPAHTPQSHILVQIRLALRRAKETSMGDHLKELAGKDFDV